MLRPNSVSRRRPENGGPHICIAITFSVFLILISLFILHSRLSSSFISSSSFLRGFTPSFPAQHDINTSLRFLDDHETSDDEEFSDDRIDIMDSGEQIVSTTENSDSDHQDLKSGYFWDHVVGVKRQAFGGRKGMGDYVEGRDERKVTFSSDDLPVDEEIRVGMSSIRVVEDALLVKSGNGESDGRLREGWANWYEVKGKFLKQDKMLARSFEVFNPMNHPLLQDPDIPHGIGLTKGDRLFRKKMWNELEQVSFGGDVKRVERRALTTGEGEKDISERMRGRSELKEEHHVYADGKRWGYYPGIQANLSFSKFMDKFLGDEHCGIRVFMVWNSPSWSYGVRQHRGLESLFRHHRDACVVVFSEKMELNFFSDLVKDGFKVALAMPDLDELLKDTPVNIFASLWNDWRKTKHYPIHYSELIRLAALYKYGGIYLDSDVIVLKPLTLVGNFIGMESKNSENSTLNGALMAFEKNSIQKELEDMLKRSYH